MRRPVRALAAAAACAVALTACTAGADGAAFSGRVLDNPIPAPSTTLTATGGGEPYSLAEDTEAPLTLVFFGYTHCPDVCPLVMSTLGAAMNRLDDADRDDVDVVFVTTDPRRDTEQELGDYLDGIDPTFLGLTGDLDDIIATGDPFGIYVSDGTKLPSGGYDLGGHTTTVVGLDADDEAVVYWSQDTSATQYAADIHTLLTDGVPAPSND